MLVDSTELGLLWEPFPLEIKELVNLQRPSLVYFYETDPLFEIVWRWHHHYYSPAPELKPEMPHWEKHQYTDITVAWYIGSQYRVEYQLVRWERHISPEAPLRKPRLILEHSHNQSRSSILDETGTMENYAYKRVPFDRVSASQSLQYAWDYLSRTDQLDALLW